MRELPLASRYQAAGAQDMNVHQWRVPRTFGDPEGEYDALRQGAGLIDLTFRVRAVVTGTDRATFLQNMLTNDIQALTPGHGCKALKLDVRGRIESKVDVLCHEEALWCDIDPGPAVRVLPELRNRIIAEDVTLQEASDRHSVLSIQGPRTLDVLSAAGMDAGGLSEVLQHRAVDVDGAEVWLVHRDHTGEDGIDLWIPRGTEPLVWSRLLPQPPGGDRASEGSSLTLVGFEALHMRRVEAGIAWHGAEVQEERFPQELGLDEEWISYTKGCYLGQETISRLHHMGHVNKQLCGLFVKGAEVPQPGTTVFHDGKEAGRVTSACLSPRLQHAVALAVLRTPSANVSTTVHLGSANGPVGEVVSLPMP
jgi:folate-binding protein YgfZ